MPKQISITDGPVRKRGRPKKIRNSDEGNLLESVKEKEESNPGSSVPAEVEVVPPTNHEKVALTGNDGEGVPQEPHPQIDRNEEVGQVSKETGNQVQASLLPEDQAETQVVVPVDDQRETQVLRTDHGHTSTFPVDQVQAFLLPGDQAETQAVLPVDDQRETQVLRTDHGHTSPFPVDHEDYAPSLSDHCSQIVLGVSELSLNESTVKQETPTPKPENKLEPESMKSNFKPAPTPIRFSQRIKAKRSVENLTPVSLLRRSSEPRKPRMKRKLDGELGATPAKRPVGRPRGSRKLQQQNTTPQTAPNVELGFVPVTLMTLKREPANFDSNKIISKDEPNQRVSLASNKQGSTESESLLTEPFNQPSLANIQMEPVDQPTLASIKLETEDQPSLANILMESVESPTLAQVKAEPVDADTLQDIDRNQIRIHPWANIEEVVEPRAPTLGLVDVKQEMDEDDTFDNFFEDMVLEPASFEHVFEVSEINTEPTSGNAGTSRKRKTVGSKKARLPSQGKKKKMIKKESDENGEVEPSSSSPTLPPPASCNALVLHEEFIPSLDNNNQFAVALRKPRASTVKSCVTGYHELTLQLKKAERQRAAAEATNSGLMKCFMEGTALQNEVLEENQRLRIENTNLEARAEKERLRAESAHHVAEKAKVYAFNAREGLRQQNFMKSGYAEAVQKMQTEYDEKMKTVEKRVNQLNRHFGQVVRSKTELQEQLHVVKRGLGTFVHSVLGMAKNSEEAKGLCMRFLGEELFNDAIARAAPDISERIRAVMTENSEEEIPEDEDVDLGTHGLNIGNDDFSDLIQVNQENDAPVPAFPQVSSPIVVDPFEFEAFGMETFQGSHQDSSALVEDLDLDSDYTYNELEGFETIDLHELQLATSISN